MGRRGCVAAAVADTGRGTSQPARFADEADEEETAFAELAAKAKKEDTFVNRAIYWIKKLTCVSCVVSSATGMPLDGVRYEVFLGAGANTVSHIIR